MTWHLLVARLPKRLLGPQQNSTIVLSLLLGALYGAGAPAALMLEEFIGWGGVEGLALLVTGGTPAAFEVVSLGEESE